MRSKERRGELGRGMGGRWTAGCLRAAAIAALASNKLATLDLSSNGLSSGGRLLDRRVRSKERRGELGRATGGRWTAGCSRAAAIAALASNTLDTLERFDDGSPSGRLLDREVRSKERLGELERGMGGRWTAGCSRAAAIAALASTTLAGVDSIGRLLDRTVRFVAEDLVLDGRTVGAEGPIDRGADRRRPR